MSASRSGRKFGLATALTGLLAAPLAVLATAVPAHAATVDIQILGTNDFHGRLLANGDEAGAAQFAGAVEQLRVNNPNTVFAAAGDLIGASTFESFIQKDKPTLDALNAAGLDVSAAGNHEFDAGYADLIDRVMKPAGVGNEDGGADWQYIAANVRKKSDNSYALPDVAASPGISDGGTWMTTIGGAEIGFVGAVTEDLPSLVSPSGIADLKITNIIAETNAAADALKAQGADLVVLLVHEGAATTDIASATDNSPFGRIVAGVDSDVGAIISGHTHLAYNHLIGGRPVVSSGQYGTNLNRLIFTRDLDTDAVTFKVADIVKAKDVALTAPAATAVASEVTGIVSAASAEAEVLGAQVLGKLQGPFKRARLANGTTENRGAESTLGNLVAEVQRWATRTPEAGGAQIAFMNPGGLRQDMVGSNAGGYPADLTYKQAAVVQPFANTLVNMSMTGAQIKKLLEQQWQRDKDGNVPSRPFLRLGTSEGFTFTYDVARPEGDRITGMRLNGNALGMGTAYSVTANSFLATGGDNFRAFTEGSGPRDTGKIDLQAMVDYMAVKSPVAPDTTQHAVGVSFPAGAPASYGYGDQVKFDLSSLAFTAPQDVQDSSVEVSVAGTALGTFAVDNTVGTAVTDEYGTAKVAFTVPKGLPTGNRLLKVKGTTTGTVVDVPMTFAKAGSTVKATAKSTQLKVRKGTTDIAVEVGSAETATGAVTALVGGKVIGAAELVGGKATIAVGPFNTVGTEKVTVKYYGDDANVAGTATVDLQITKVKPRIKIRGLRYLKPGTRVKHTVIVGNTDLAIDGKVRVVIKATGKSKFRKKVVIDVKNGVETIRLPKLRKAGRYKAVYTFLGSDIAKRSKKEITLRVRR